MEFQGLTYEVMGEGIPIVFLHGLYLDRESTMFFFEPQVRFNGFKRIYIDLPGMGSSIATPSASANSIFDSLKNFIVSIVGQKKFILFGHSYGAQKSINWTIFIQLLRQHLRYDCDYKN